MRVQTTPQLFVSNQGGGKFVNVSAASGIAGSLGKSFGAVATDINNDGLMDSSWQRHGRKLPVCKQRQGQV